MAAQVAVERFHAHTGSTWWWVIFAVGELFYLAYAIHCVLRLVSEVRKGKPSSG